MKLQTITKIFTISLSLMLYMFVQVIEAQDNTLPVVTGEVTSPAKNQNRKNTTSIQNINDSGATGQSITSVRQTGSSGSSGDISVTTTNTINGDLNATNGTVVRVGDVNLSGSKTGSVTVRTTTEMKGGDFKDGGTHEFGVVDLMDFEGDNVEMRIDNSIQGNSNSQAGGVVTIGNVKVGGTNSNTDYGGSKRKPGDDVDCVGDNCNGEDRSTPIAYGTPCDDGKFCTSFDGNIPGDDHYSGNMCSGKSYQESPYYEEIGVGLDININKWVSVFKKALDLSSKIKHGVTAIPPSVSVFGNTKSSKPICCEKKKKILSSHHIKYGISGSGGASIRSPSVPFPGFPLVRLGLGGAIKLKGSININHIENSCSNLKDCTSVTGNLGGNVDGELIASIADPRIIHVSGGVRGTGDYVLLKRGSCAKQNRLPFKGCIFPSIYAKLSVVGGLIDIPFSYSFSDFKACIS